MSVNVNCFSAHLYDMYKSIQLKISFTFTKCNSNSVLRLLLSFLLQEFTPSLCFLLGNSRNTREKR